MDGSILDRVDLNYKKSSRYQGVIKIRKSKNRQYNGQKKKTKGQTMIYKA